MTPREGVEPVAWAVVDKDGAFWDAAPLSSKECADKRAAVLNRTRDGYPTPYTVVPLYAHPAATAREEAIRAEVIEECARVCEARAAKHHGTLTEDLGESYELGWREDEGKDCAEAIRALALARSTGGDVNA